MVDKLDRAFNFNAQALNLRHERQKVLATNIANADTPGFKAKDIDFAQALKKATDSGSSAARSSLQMRTTNSAHIKASPLPSRLDSEDVKFRVAEQPSLDGNTVDMDRERANFMDNSIRYQSAMSAINGQIRGMRTAMKE